jgi:tetratricopeptide (TPR) repeat protein
MRTRRQIAVALVLFLLCVGGIGIGAWQIGWHVWGMAEWRAAKQALAQRDFTQARAHLAACLRIWPEDGDTLLLAAQAARRAGALAEARPLLNQYQRLHGLSKAHGTEWQLLQLQSGDVSEAGDYLAYCTAYPEAPETPLVLEALIKGALLASDGADAMTAVNLWLTRAEAPADRVQGLVWRGDVWMQLGYTGNSLRDYREALSLNPEDYDARVRLAACLAGFAPEDALEHLQYLQSRRPQDRAVLLHLGRCRRSLGQFTEASRLFDELLATDPEYTPALVERGRVALDLGQPAEAERWLQQAQAARPSDPTANQLLARCLHEMGKHTQARQYETLAAQGEARAKARAAEARKAIFSQP